MDHKHFQWTKRPFSAIFKTKLTNQVIRYRHEGQVQTKIMLVVREQVSQNTSFVQPKPQKRFDT